MDRMQDRERLVGELVDLCRRIADLDGKGTAPRDAAPGVSASENDMASGFGQMPLLIWSADRDLRVVCHAGGAALDGSMRAETLPELYGRVFDEAVSAPSVAHLQRALAGETVQFGLSAGSHIVEHLIAPMRDAEQNIVGVVGFSTDVTRRQRVEEQVRQSLQMEALAKMAGGIAHDFNNVLTGIMGNIALASLYVQDDSDVQALLHHAENAALRARDLTQQLLVFSTDGTPVKKVISISRLIADVAAGVLRGSGTRYELAIADDLWLTQVDEEQISRALHNVIANADQSMLEGGTVTIRARNVELGREDALPLSDGRYVEIGVADEGVGITRENLSRVFEPYFTTKQKRSGLGLAVSHSIIRSHAGLIMAESKPGLGSIFRIYLPAVPAPQAPERVQLLEEALAGAGRILIMDDEKLVRETVGEMLTRMGYEVQFARDGQEALDLYESVKAAGEPFDAVIMDLTVPGGMGGMEANSRLRQLDPGAKTIVSSGYATDPIMANYASYGFQGMLAKPYRLSDLRHTLYQVIFEIDV